MSGIDQMRQTIIWARAITFTKHAGWWLLDELGRLPKERTKQEQDYADALDKLNDALNEVATCAWEFRTKDDE